MMYRGSSFPFFMRRIRRVAGGLAGLLLLAGCQMAPQGVSVAPTPSTLIYSYIIANGMARGHIMVDRLTTEQIVSLAATDHMTLLAILLAAREPTPRNFERANNAMVLYLQAIDGQAIAPVPATTSGQK